MGRRPVVYDHPQMQHIVFSVALTDGSFNSNVSVPINASEAEKMKAVTRWLEIMMFGIKLPGEVLIKTAMPATPEKSS